MGRNLQLIGRNKNQMLRKQNTYIILLLILTGVCFYLRTANRELYCDEIMYGYKLNATKYGEYWTSPKTALDGEINTVKDVVDSQINYYQYANGRIIPHSIEQLFTGVWGLDIFYIFNTIIFLLLVSVCVKVYMTKSQYLSWLIALIALLYLFPYPSKLWFSVNLAPNYLLPAFLTIYFIYLWQANKKNNVFLFVIVGVLLGCTNEAFAIPLSGAMLIYYLLHFKMVKTKKFVLTVSLWVGTVIMILSPGNISRFIKSNTGESNVVDTILNACKLFLELKVIWVLLAILLLYCIFDFKGTVQLLKRNLLLIYMLGIGLLFGLIANTAYHSFTAVEFFAFLILIQIIDRFIENLKYQRVISIVLTTLFIVHQVMIVRAEMTQAAMQRNIIENVMENKDRVVVYDNSYLTPWVKPFVTTWAQNGPYLLYSNPFKYKYGDIPIVLSQIDYDALPKFDRLATPENKVNSEVPLYYFGGKMIWGRACDVKEKRKFILKKPLKDGQEKPEEFKASLREIKTRWGRFFYINYSLDELPTEVILK